MITFILTFLLSFNINPEINVVKQKKTKKNKPKKQRKSEQLEQTEIKPEITKDYELNCGNLINSIRIEYELIPKKFKYGIDIICWENIAKITTVDGFRYYKTVKDKNFIWVPLTVHHFIKKLNEMELVSLHGHVINFSINIAKKDNISKLFVLYCKKKEAKSENIVEYFEEDPNLVKKRTGRTERYEVRNALRKCATDGVSSLLKFSDRTHTYMVNNTISCTKKGTIIKYKEFNVRSNEIVTEEASGKKIANKNSKKKKITRKKKDKEPMKGNPQFILPGEVFFIDPRLAVYKLKDANHSITNGFIFLTVENLMTREQKSSLNPFIVKLRGLKFLPADLLREYGYEKIFISFEIPNFLQYESSPKPIQENIYFDDYRAYFSKDVSKLKYLEFMRSERVKVKINGILAEKQIKPSLFGSKKEDANISKILQPREAFDKLREINSSTKTQVLCVANFDISSLLKDVWTFREEAPCHHPDSLLYGIERISSQKFVDLYTAAEANFGILDNDMNKSPLLEGILASASTTLDMEFHFVAPQLATMYLQMNSNAFKRLFFTVYDRSLAQIILASIIQNNENIIGINALLSNYVWIEDKIDMELKKRDVSKDLAELMESIPVKSELLLEDVQRDVLTGFMIDNGIEIYIFIEGIRHGYILEIWNLIHKANPDVAKIFLNSQNEFQNRIYDSFVPTGILKITLKKSLQDLFQEQVIYVAGSVPLPCFKALQKLNLILKTDTLHKILQFNLLPTSDELLNFNFEFGVPLKMHI